MWEMACADYNTIILEDYLKNRWEPFSVTKREGANGPLSQIWLRRRVRKKDK